VTLNWALCKVGTVIVGGTAGVGARLIIRLQFALGQDILTEDTLHVSRALHGHLMYFLPAGGGLIGVASWQLAHLTTR